MFLASEYELLDFGAGRKLERFGGVVLDRPAPNAERQRRAVPQLWSQAASRFDRLPPEAGCWTGDDVRSSWLLRAESFVLQLKRTDAGQVGVFPEQADNWRWLAAQVAGAPVTDAAHPLEVLNLFAYTGAATLALAAAGAAVVHVDAARTSVGAARLNAELSGLAAHPVRWVVDDVLKFVRRELRRGRRYDAVVLDPPSYGHGPSSETWKLADQLPELLELCSELTADRRRFILLTCHTPGFDRRAAADVLKSCGLADGQVEAIELELTTRTGKRLPSGIAVRWTRPD